MSVIISNFHTHSSFCDGKAEPEAFIVRALDRGFRHLGFSSHAPVPFETSWCMKIENFDSYINAIVTLKKRFWGTLDIMLGLERDYLPGEVFPEELLQKLGSPRDYTIGAVHFLGQLANGTRWTVDDHADSFESGLYYTFHGDIKLLASEYFRRILDMVRSMKPDIIAHFDLVKKNNPENRYFDEEEPWYRDIVHQTVSELAHIRDIIIEVNTGGISRNVINDVYPSEWVLKACFQKNIALMLNADAHRPEDIDAAFPLATEKIRRAGYRKLVCFSSQGRYLTSL